MMQDVSAVQALDQITQLLRLVAVAVGIGGVVVTGLTAVLIQRLQKVFAARPVGADQQVPSTAEMHAAIAKVDVELRQFVHNAAATQEVTAGTRHTQVLSELKEVKEWMVKAFERADEARDTAKDALAEAHAIRDAVSHERELRTSEVRRLEVIRGGGD